MKWLQQRLEPRYFTLVLSLLVGLAAGLAANLLKWFIHRIEHLLTHNFVNYASDWRYLLYPVLGILLSGLFIKYVIKDNIGHGVTKILYSISRNHGFIKSHNCWSSIVASGITIGFGGSVGAESPIVLTGSALGSRIGHWFNQDHRTLMILIGCGASGAVAGIFKAPLAGLLFTVEVLMIDLTLSSLLPLLISCVTATCVSYAITGNASTFHFTLGSPFVVERIVPTLALGLLCGFMGLYFTRVMNHLEAFFAKIQSFYLRFLIAGLSLAVLIFLFPALYGEGYGLIESLLNPLQSPNQLLHNSFFYGQEHLLLLYLVLILLFKVFATTATNAGGGCGGTFAPSLFLGAILGFCFAQLWNMWHPFGITIPETNAVLYGMAGTMSAIFHAPLTGIFLIAELAGGYQLLVPLMIVGSGSFLTIRCFEAHSIYSMRLAMRGELLTHHKDQSAITLMNLEQVTDNTRPVLAPDMKLGKMLQIVATCKHLHFAVCAPDGTLLGLINLNNIRHLIFRSELYNYFTVQALMETPQAQLYSSETMRQIMEKFQQQDWGTLPLIDDKGCYLGFVNRGRLYSLYRKILQDFSDE